MNSIDAANEQQQSDTSTIYPDINSIEAPANRQQHSDAVIIWPEQRADDIEADAVPSLLDLGEIYFYVL